MIKLLTKTDKNVTSFWVSFPLCTRTLPPSLHPTHTSPLPPAYTYTRSLPHTLSLLCVSHPESHAHSRVKMSTCPSSDTDVLVQL